ncbi:MAG: hypothetical protein LBI62_05755, partial [Candidatus Accumulibacter sp.]|nr:hypothetical protein [Accumulibacter sp.]
DGVEAFVSQVDENEFGNIGLIFDDQRSRFGSDHEARIKPSVKPENPKISVPSLRGESDIGTFREGASKIAGCRGIIPLPGCLRGSAPQGLAFKTPLRKSNDQGTQARVPFSSRSWHV